ncbi:MAG TPA: proline/glycine betaine transporter ProP [Escherichia sp.]|nr:proline/glycine betaine transporter ProP [Escherichia sp.]
MLKRKKVKPITLGDVTIIDDGKLRKAITAASLGNAMEWFDFGVYGFVAYALGKVFFPDANPSVQMIAALGTFSVPFLIRPLGGLFFGMLGDKYGRQKILAITIVIMSISTFCIGLIPSYESIGIWAPILLLVCKMAQGFSVGGEYTGASIFVAEYSPDRKRGFMGSWLDFGSIAGFVLGAGVVVILSTVVGEENFLDWGWRIPFFLAAPLGLFGLYIRLKLEETPAFKDHMDKQEALEHSKPQLTLIQMLNKHRKQILKCIGLVLVFNVSNYMLTSYMPSYLTSVLGMSELTGLLLVMVIMFVMMPLTLAWGYWTDRIGRRPVIALGAAGLVLLAIPSFMLIGSGNMLAVFGGLVILGVLHTCFSGTMPATLPALFVTDIRYSALAIGFNLSVSLFGGTTPLVTAWLVDTTHNVMMPAYYMMGAGIIGLITVLTLRETAQKPLSGSSPAVATHAEAHRLIDKLRKQKRSKHLQAQVASK